MFDKVKQYALLAVPAVVAMVGVTVDMVTSTVTLSTGDTANISTGIGGMATTIGQTFFTVLPYLFIIPVTMLILGLLKGWLSLKIGKGKRRR